ncbi:unnamed protein product [Microthlaspi erraticum]|uniref:Uncharacterized protein n=1 Tax=Microthlaspi erraticum TaxID=1685480 RepID=A0A6D2KGB2_9BRAS|nr:unnamed protein product [Microthlaspi erraticum]
MRNLASRARSDSGCKIKDNRSGGDGEKEIDDNRLREDGEDGLAKWRKRNDLESMRPTTRVIRWSAWTWTKTTSLKLLAELSSFMISYTIQPNCPNPKRRKLKAVLWREASGSSFLFVSMYSHGSLS